MGRLYAQAGTLLRVLQSDTLVTQPASESLEITNPWPSEEMPTEYAGVIRSPGRRRPPRRSSRSRRVLPRSPRVDARVGRNRLVSGAPSSASSAVIAGLGRGQPAAPDCSYLTSVTVLLHRMILDRWPPRVIVALPSPVAAPAWSRLLPETSRTRCHCCGLPLQECLLRHTPTALLLPCLMRTVKEIRSPRLQTGAGPLARTFRPRARSVAVGSNAPLVTAPANSPSGLVPLVNRKNGVGTGPPWQAAPSALNGFVVQFEEIGSRTSA